MAILLIGRTYDRPDALLLPFDAQEDEEITIRYIRVSKGKYSWQSERKRNYAEGR